MHIQCTAFEKCFSWHTSEEAIGNDCNVICLNALRASHGVAQVVIHSQVAPQGTGVVNVHNVDMAMHWISSSASSWHATKHCPNHKNRPGVLQPLELLSGQEPAQVRTYKVCVLTGSCKGAGTTSNVSLSLFGPNNQRMGPMPLESGRFNFQRSALDEFEVVASSAADNVAPVEAVEVKVDGVGAAPEWFLDQIIITSDGLGKSTFLCHDWLGPANLTRRLSFNLSMETVARRMYQITVHTGTPCT
jgi:hypothetical protein